MDFEDMIKYTFALVVFGLAVFAFNAFVGELHRKAAPEGSTVITGQGTISDTVNY